MHKSYRPYSKEISIPIHNCMEVKKAWFRQTLAGLIFMVCKYTFHEIWHYFSFIYSFSYGQLDIFTFFCLVSIFTLSSQHFLSSAFPVRLLLLRIITYSDNAYHLPFQNLSRTSIFITLKLGVLQSLCQAQSLLWI